MQTSELIHSPATACLVVTMIAVQALFQFTQPARAHDSWISRQRFHDPNSGAWCCDEHDCSALEEIDVRDTGDGFMVAGKYFVARQRVLPSTDGSYWACFNSEGNGAHDRKPGVRCFFAPMSA